MLGHVGQLMGRVALHASQVWPVASHLRDGTQVADNLRLSNMACIELVDVLPSNPVTVLLLPDGSRWYRGKCLMGLAYFARCDINNALYHNLPEQAYFKGRLGELLVRAGTTLEDLDRPEACPALRRSDVMLSAFGVLYITLKRGNTCRHPLSNGQEAIIRHVVPLLATQPAYCTIPAELPCTPEVAGAAPQPKPIAPDSLWFDVETLLDRLGLCWPQEKTKHLIQKHMPNAIKQSVQYDVMFPLVAAPFIKPWLIACFNEEAQDEFQWSAGTRSEEGYKRKWATNFCCIQMKDIEAIIDDIQRSWL
jgi:hypothetical protein